MKARDPGLVAKAVLASIVPGYRYKLEQQMAEETLEVRIRLVCGPDEADKVIEAADRYVAEWKTRYPQAPWPCPTRADALEEGYQWAIAGYASSFYHPNTSISIAGLRLFRESKVRRWIGGPDGLPQSDPTL